MAKHKGIIPAIITPFNEDGSVFEQGIINEIDFLHTQGFTSIFVCGSYGAFPVMTDEQRKLVADRVVSGCKERGIKTIIHIGSTSLETATELAKHAEGVGADAISTVVPFYYSTTFYTEDNFLRYFEGIIDSVSIDIHCYNNTKTTGFNISPSFLKKLINLGVCGIKDGGSDMGKMLEMLHVVKESGVEFDYYPSSTSSLITGFVLGVDACISGVALSVPELVLGIYNNMMDKNIDEAIILYEKVMKARAILGSKTGRAIAAYDVLKERGIDVGTCKLPWEKLSFMDARYVIEELKEIGAI